MQFQRLTEKLDSVGCQLKSSLNNLPISQSNSARRKESSLNQLLRTGQLTCWDRRIILAVWNYGALRRDLIIRLLCDSEYQSVKTTADRLTCWRLTLLCEWGLLEQTQLPDFSDPIYLLPRKGGELVAALEDTEKLGDVWRKKDVTKMLLYMTHRQEAAEFAVTLAEALRPHSAFDLDWRGEDRLDYKLPNGKSVRPDGLGAVTMEPNTWYLLMFEWDRGTETIGFFGQKMQKYIQLLKDESVWSKYFSKRPAIVIVTTRGQRRLENMKAEIERQIHLGLQDWQDKPFVLVTNLTAIKANGILADIFYLATRPTDEDKASILGNLKKYLPTMPRSQRAIA